MVTKQEQLEWLAARFESLPFHSDIILMSDEALGYVGCEHKITNKELKRERDKMQKQNEKSMSENEFEDELEKMYWDFDSERAKKSKCERLNFKIFMRIASGLRVESKKDNSWFERGELPPVGCECVWVDESGVDCPAGVRYPDVGEVVSVRAHADTPGGDVIAIFTWESGGDGLRVAASRMPEDFRPLRTEREKAIDEMFQAAFSIGSEINAETIGALYDAGYRKVKP